MACPACLRVHPLVRWSLLEATALPSLQPARSREPGVNKPHRGVRNKGASIQHEQTQLHTDRNITLASCSCRSGGMLWRAALHSSLAASLRSVQTLPDLESENLVLTLVLLPAGCEASEKPCHFSEIMSTLQMGRMILPWSGGRGDCRGGYKLRLSWPKTRRHCRGRISS